MQRIFGQMFGEKKANQLDFRQIRCTLGFLYELILKI